MTNAAIPAAVQEEIKPRKLKAAATAAAAARAVNKDAAVPKQRHAVTGCGSGRIRLVGALANALMTVYIYAEYLRRIHWRSFGRLIALEEATSQRLVDYLYMWDLDASFEHLRSFTFSEAMFHNLEIFTLVGTPVAFIYFNAERRRVRWLQAFVADSKLDCEQAHFMSQVLELYYWLVSIAFVFVLLLAPFHLGNPRGHYLFAGGAFSFGFGSICTYLWVSKDFSAIAEATGDASKVAWASRVDRWVRPTLKTVAWLHVVAFVAALLKAEDLADDRKALLFGVLETLTVLGYQAFVAVFAVDDEAMRQCTTVDDSKLVAAPQAPLLNEDATKPDATK